MQVRTAAHGNGHPMRAGRLHCDRHGPWVTHPCCVGAPGTCISRWVCVQLRTVLCSVARETQTTNTRQGGMITLGTLQ